MHPVRHAVGRLCLLMIATSLICVPRLAAQDVVP
jgi:hypothetical protein